MDCGTGMSITLTEVVALGGLISGIAGFVLGVLNFRRDRVQLDVLLQWDMAIVIPGLDNDATNPATRWGVVRVQNVGRRPTFISHVALHVPKGYDHDHIMAMDSVTGEKLSEGDAPKIYPLTQVGMEQYAKDWRKLTAQVSDSTGRIWKAPRIARNKRPSWAEPKPAGGA
jgi:hypothetical protein